MKRILQTITHLGPGGVQSLVIPLSIELKRGGYPSYVLSFEPIDNKFQEDKLRILESENVMVLIPPQKLTSRVSKLVFLYKMLKKYRISLIHAHTPIPPIYISIVAFMLRIPVILTFHNTKLWSKTKQRIFGFLIIQLCRPFIKKYIAISKEVQKVMNKKYLIPLSKIKMVYNGIDIGSFQSKVVSHNQDLKILDVIKDKYVITHISVIDFERKNQHEVVRLFKEVNKVIPNSVILFIGDGKDYNALSKLIVGDDKIYALGSRNDIPWILSISDILILPSNKEGLPITLLEAMAAGVPVIASNVGSIPEIITHGINGLLIEPTNLEKLIESIIELKANKVLYNKISAQSKLRIESFSFESFYKKHLSLYRNILDYES